MVIKILKNSWIIFKPILFLNLLFSGIGIYWLYLAGFQNTRAYAVALFIKGSGYALGLLVEWVFISQHRNFLKNQGIGNGRLFVTLSGVDFIIFSICSMLLWLTRVYL